MSPGLEGLPSEILAQIADAGAGVWMLACSSRLLDLLLPRLYGDVRLASLEQLARFLAPASGAQRYAADWTRRLTVNIPGVPGGGDGTALRAKRDRLLQAARALLLCPRVEHVSFEFFSIRHSDLLTSTEFRLEEATTFRMALDGARQLRSFRWRPPRSERSAIMGLSVVVVDQVVQTLALGLAELDRLETLELWNVMLPADGGCELAKALVGNKATVKLRSVTNLDPGAIAIMLNAGMRVEVEDGFCGSIWGPRIDASAVQESLRDLSADVSLLSQLELTAIEGQ